MRSEIIQKNEHFLRKLRNFINKTGDKPNDKDIVETHDLLPVYLQIHWEPLSHFEGEAPGLQTTLYSYCFMHVYRSGMSPRDMSFDLLYTTKKREWYQIQKHKLNLYYTLNKQRPGMMGGHAFWPFVHIKKKVAFWSEYRQWNMTMLKRWSS